MYVPQSAADDDEIEEEAQISPTQHINEDDEEPLLQHHLKRLEVAGSVRSGSAARGHLEIAASTESIVSLKAAEKPETAVEVPRRAPGDTLPAKTTHEVPTTDTIALAQVVRDSPELSPEVRAAEKTTTSPEIAEKEESSPAVANNGKVSDVPGAAMELSTTQQILIPQETAQSSQGTNSASPSRDAAAPLPPAALSVPEGTESRKRTIEPTNEGRPSKLQRIDVDLTVNEDDDMVLVKTEKLEDQDQKFLKNRNGVKSIAELEEDLEDILLQQTEVDLKRRAAKLRREMRKLNESDSRAAVKHKSAVKIEID